MGHFEGDLALLVDVLLSKIDSTFDTLDIFVCPIQSLALSLNLFELINHELPLFDALINDIIKLSYELLNVTLHLVHSLLICPLNQIAFNLSFVPRKLRELLVLRPDLAHEALDKSVLNLLLSGLLHGHNLPLHHVDSVLPLGDGVRA